MIQCGGREDGKSNQDAGAITVIGGNKQNPRVGNSTSLLNSRIAMKIQKKKPKEQKSFIKKRFVNYVIP